MFIFLGIEPENVLIIRWFMTTDLRVSDNVREWRIGMLMKNIPADRLTNNMKLP